MVETELVLPVTIGHPSGHELRVLRTPEGLGSVEGQTDRFAVDFGLGGSSATGQTERRILIAFRAIEAGAAAARWNRFCPRALLNWQAFGGSFGTLLF